MDKQAKKEYDQQRYLANKEKTLERNAQWRQDNKEQWNAIIRSWNSRNRAKVNARARELYLPTKRRARYLAHKYGITLDDYQAMLEGQKFTCPCCDQRFDEIKSGNSQRIIHVDHCHETGEIRGLLCRLCNLMLGWYEKNQEGVATYLGGG